MCQSIANGGWRCATHEPGNNAMASWAQASAGLPLSETRSVFMALKDQGAGAADPSQDEVVEFLTTQEFHVRNAENLSESRRARMVSQLRSALSRAWKKILPDGQTFYAWKNVTSECWSRAKRKFAASVLLGGLSLTSLTGCGGTMAQGADGSAAAPTQTSISASVTPGPAATSSQSHQRSVMTANDPQFKLSTVSGTAVNDVGKVEATAAYKAAVLFTMNVGSDGPSLTTPGKYTDKDLAPAKAAMTPKAFADLKKQADAANAGDATARKGVLVVVAKDLTIGSPYTYRPGNTPVASRKTFSSATGADTYESKVYLKFTTEVDYKLLNAKKQPVTVHVKRNEALAMKHVGSAWLIDGWTITQDNPTTTID